MGSRTVVHCRIFHVEARSPQMHQLAIGENVHQTDTPTDRDPLGRRGTPHKKQPIHHHTPHPKTPATTILHHINDTDSKIPAAKPGSDLPQ